MERKKEEEEKTGERRRRKSREKRRETDRETRRERERGESEKPTAREVRETPGERGLIVNFAGEKRLFCFFNTTGRESLRQ